MDKHLPLIALAILWPSVAFGQCSGIFPPGTYCGNTTASPAPPVPTALSITGIVGPGTSTNNGLPIWSGTTGTTLKDGAGQTIAGTYTWGGAQTYSAGATFATGTYNFTGTFQLGGTTFALPVPVTQGGTGNTTATAHSIPINEGTSAQVNTGAGTAGQVLTSGGAGADPSWTNLAYGGGATLSTTVANPGSTSGAGVMMGLGSTCHITPLVTSRLHVAIEGQSANNSTGGGAIITLRYGTGTAPINAAANTGTVISGSVNNQNPTAIFPISFHTSGLATGLTPGTAVWFDVTLAATNGGVASISSLWCWAFEF
jgi:hypothetical protein